MKNKLYFTIPFLVFQVLLFAQQNGGWRLHFKHSISKDIAYSKTKIMSATAESLLLYNIDDSSLRELDKSNALSDIGIAKISYNLDQKTFIVAYNSTNIDFITDELVVTNFPDVKNKIIAGSKDINNIFNYGSKAYLATDLGIIVVDLINQEVDETYVIGNSGNPVPVMDIAILNDTIYAITENQGLKFAAINGQNLLDFSNWKVSPSTPSGSSNFIEIFESALYYGVNNNKIYKKSNANWELIFNDNDAEITSLMASNKLVAVYKKDSLGTALSERFLIIDNDKTDTVINDRSLNPKIGIFNNDGRFFIADFSWGLFDYDDNSILAPFGKPFGSDVFALSSYGNKVFNAPGTMDKGINAGYNFNGFYYFEDNAWKNVNKFNTEGLNPVLNFVDIKVNPANNKVYGATTTGLVEYDYNTITLYDTANSIIEKQTSGGTSRFITGVDFDSKGNIWMVNSRTTTPLLVLSKDGEWYKYPLSFGGNIKYGKITVDQNNQKWVAIRGRGISVFPDIEDLAGNYSGYSISLTIGSANLPNDNVNVITQDKSGTIWVGTDEGIAVFDCPENIFDNTTDCIVSRRIKSTLDEYTEYLFDTDNVFDIAIDGANRKWVGTSSGAYLLSESGDEILLSFNTENSPMPSNEVIAISIQEETGEVFIGTELGVASYFGDATEPAEDISNIKAFPNPIRPEYKGTISVTGLVENTYIKITDINGTLIHDGNALGGKFVWDGKDYSGNRAKSGVYLVFSSDNKSKNKAVAKILFIN